MIRMVDLLVDRKRDILAAGRRPTVADFDEAWSEFWDLMVDERAWQHATDLRRDWRTAMRLARTETCDAFVDVSRRENPVWSAIGAALAGHADDGGTPTP